MRLCLLLCFQALASVPWVSLFLLALIPHCLNSCSFIKTLGIQFHFSSSSCLGCCWPLASFYMRVFAMVPPTPRPLHMFLLLKHPSLLSSPGYSSDDTLSCHFLREAFPGPPGPGQMSTAKVQRQECTLGFPGGSDGKESTCNAEELGWIPGLRR